MFARLKVRHEFSWNVLTSLSGSAISQAIPIAVMPILAHLYDPSMFGIFSLYIALSSICSVMATGRYELAIMQPKQDIEAVNIAGLSLICSAFMALVFLLLIYVLHENLVSLIGNINISNWLYLIPLSIFFTGIFQVLSYWSNRKKKFSRIAMSKVVQGSSTAAIQLVMGVKKFNGFGLILGNFLGLVLAVLWFGKNIWKRDKELTGFISAPKMWFCLKKYRNFPIYSLWGAMLDSAALQMPILMLSKFYSTEVTGIFSLTFRTLNLPMVLIAASISPVLFQRVTYLNNHNPQLLYSHVIKAFCVLLVLSLPFLLIMLFWGVDLFSMVFGPQWAQAGEYASIIVLAIVVRFAVSPLSTVLAIEHNLKLGFIWQIIYFFTISVTLYFAAQYSIKIFIIAFVIHEVILYLIYFYLILMGTKQYQKYKHNQV